MNGADIVGSYVKDPLAWAADCRAQAGFPIEPEARAAFTQLAEEFDAIASEIDGLVGTYEALIRRKCEA